MNWKIVRERITPMMKTTSIETDIEYHEANGGIDGLTMATNLLQQYETV